MTYLGAVVLGFAAGLLAEWLGARHGWRVAFVYAIAVVAAGAFVIVATSIEAIPVTFGMCAFSLAGVARSALEHRALVRNRTEHAH
jgi:MFS family permease